MKIVTFEVERKQKLGILNADGKWIYPLDCFGMDYRAMRDAIEELSESEIQFLNHMALICLGVNYMAHAEESARYKKESFNGERPHAVYFSKRVNYATGDKGGIPRHANLAECLDYEVELAVIIGKDAYHVSAEDAKNYIFGYTIINDVSARDVQNRHSQWYFGKSLDGFFPMGPCIVSADEIAYPPKLSIRSYVNGELRQDSNTELLIFDIDHIISELSGGMTLRAGTIIATGTPAGAGLGFDPPKFLKTGDEVVCEIEGIGRLTNIIVDE